MRMVVKQGDRVTNELRFDDGPIHIGRHATSEIVLHDRTVSKQHAIIYTTNDGTWMLKDTDSANNTYLNDKLIQEAEIKTGDRIRITDFTIEIDPEVPDVDTSHPEDTLHLEASLATPPHETVIRKPDAGHAPAMRLPAKRLTDFSRATDSISQVKSLEELLPTLMDIMVRQFSAFHVWCALREQPSGPMTYQAGKRRDGRKTELGDLILAEKIEHAIERGQSLVLPRVAAQIETKERVRSALIATIMRSAGCYGILYADNAMMHEHYRLSDLDYLMLVAIHTSAVLKNLLGL